MGGTLTKVDLGHGRGWLAPAPAASVKRIDAALGRPADINEAGRSPEKADANHAAWIAYQNGTGPKAPYALPASASVHVPGEAVDSDDWYDPDAAAVWRDHGWRQTARYDDDRDEPWHGEYFEEHDNHINDPEPVTLEADMILIESLPSRGRAVIGPGYFRKLRNSEELVQASKLVTRTVKGNARQFDVWKAIALAGNAPAAAVQLTDAQLEQITTAAREGGADAIAGLEFVVRAEPA